jgi:hypothetical protein
LMTAKLSVRGSPPVTHVTGSVPGAWCVAPLSLGPAPPAPPPVAQLCSQASSLLRQDLTSRARAPIAGYGSSPSRCEPTISSLRAGLPPAGTRQLPGAPSTSFVVASSKDVDADPGLRSGQAFRRHDGEGHRS